MNRNRSIINTLPAIASMLGDKNNIKVTISGTGAYTDGVEINLPVLPDTPELITLARGYIDHEAGHIRLTDFNVRKKPGIEGDLTNVLEDVRIEKGMAEIFPGCKKILRDLAALVKDEGGFDFIPKEGEVLASEAFLGWLVSALRCSVLEQHELQPVADEALEVLEDIFLDEELDALMDLAIEGSVAGSTQEVANVASRMVTFLEDCQKKREQQEQEQGQQEQDEEGSSCQESGGSSSDQDDDNQSPGSSDEGQDGDDASDQQPSTGDGEENKSSSSDSQKEGDSDQGSCTSQQSSQENASPDKQKMAIEKILQGSNGAGDCSVSDMGQKIEKILDKASEQAVEDGLVSASDILLSGEKYKPEGEEKIDVSKVRGASAQLRSRLSGLIQSAQYRPSFAQDPGRRIEAGKLSRLAARDARIFRQETVQRSVNTAVTILIDNSTSMAGNDIVVAREAALAVSLALDSIKGVAITTAAFPGKYSHIGNNTIAIMTSFGETAKRTAHRYAIPAYGGTPTSEALNWAGAQLARRKETRKLCFVITDGQPNDSSAAKASCRRLEKCGVEVFGIGIDTDAVFHVFPRSTKISDVKDLANAMFTLLRQELTKQLVA